MKKLLGLTFTLITLPALAMERAKESKEEEIVIHSKAETQGVEKLSPGAKEFLLDITSVKGECSFISSKDSKYVLVTNFLKKDTETSYSTVLYQTNNLINPIKTFDGQTQFSNNSKYIAVIKNSSSTYPRNYILEIFDISSLEKPIYAFNNFGSQWDSDYRFSSDSRYLAYLTDESPYCYKVIRLSDGKTVTINNCERLYFGWDVSNESELNSFENFTDLPKELQQKILDLAMHGSIDQAFNKEEAITSVLNLKKASKYIKEQCDSVFPPKQLPNERNDIQDLRNKLTIKQVCEPIIALTGVGQGKFNARIYPDIFLLNQPSRSMEIQNCDITIPQKNIARCWVYSRFGTHPIEWNLLTGEKHNLEPNTASSTKLKPNLKWTHPNGTTFELKEEEGYKSKQLPGNVLALYNKEESFTPDHTQYHFLHNTPTYVFLTDPNGMQDHDAQLLNKIYEGISKNSPVQLTENEMGTIQLWPEHLKKCIEQYLNLNN